MLLYSEYIVKAGWTPPPDNPSKLKVISSPSGNFIDDDFSDCGYYLGVVENNVVVACCRVIVGMDAELEVTRYTPLPSEFDARAKYAEINRFASQYRGDTLFEHLLRMGMATAKEHGAEICLTTAPLEDNGQKLITAGFSRSSLGFRYHSTDPAELFIFSLPL